MCADKIRDFLVSHVVNFAVPALITISAGAALWTARGIESLVLAVLTTQGLMWLGLAWWIEYTAHKIQNKKSV